MASPQSPKPVNRANMAEIAVIGLGLGRTGTMSLKAALDMLGFGPCYHPLLAPKERDDWLAWAHIAEGNPSPEDFDNILKGYHSVVDSPVAIKAPEIFRAYPNAKYILTIRNPESWEKSIHETTLAGWDFGKEHPEKIPPEMQSLFRWNQSYFVGYHHDRLGMHGQQEILDHNKRIQELIPADQLLIFDVREGWTKLANFLGVDVPNEPFPRLNEGASFREQFFGPIRELASQTQNH